MNTVRTVSDTKRAFYNTHTRPINSIYRRVVEELMVEMHLLTVNADFRYDSIYALGVVTTFDRFMQGYRPEADRQSIFHALCQAMGEEMERYQRDADLMKAQASDLTFDGLMAQLTAGGSAEGEGLVPQLRQVGENSKFKYNRLFVIGLYTLLETMDANLVKDEKRRNEALQKVSEALHLSFDKIQKDLELYRSNLDKFTQAQAVLDDILKADRKKKEEREKAKDAIATPPASTQE